MPFDRLPALSSVEGPRRSVRGLAGTALPLLLFLFLSLPLAGFGAEEAAASPSASPSPSPSPSPEATDYPDEEKSAEDLHPAVREFNALARKVETARAELEAVKIERAEKAEKETYLRRFDGVVAAFKALSDASTELPLSAEELALLGRWFSVLRVMMGEMRGLIEREVNGETVTPEETTRALLRSLSRLDEIGRDPHGRSLEEHLEEIGAGWRAQTRKNLRKSPASPER